MQAYSRTMAQNRRVLYAVMVLAFCVIGSNAACTVTSSCWPDGCTIQVSPSPWTPSAHETFHFNSNNANISPNEIWSATIVSQNYNTYEVVLASYTTSHWGFNVRGVNEVPIFECEGGAPPPTINTGAPPTINTAAPPTTLAPGPTASGDIVFPTVSLTSSFNRMQEFINTLTTIEDFSSSARAVHSSGGAAGGVVSEGQGYGLLIAATVAHTASGSNQQSAKNYAFEFFRGWKKMCQLTDSGSCQSGGYICETNPCLSNWKLNDQLTGTLGTGSASDGDEDAILGMIILVETTAAENPSWWNEVARWAYNSCKAFMDFNTILNSSGANRILRLGSCWGGWDCANPSYYAPAHYRVFRDFMIKYSGMFGSSNSEGLHYRSRWNELINSVYQVLEANQCSQTGLTTNWFVPSESNPSSGGTTSCSGSGTPAGEYGSEAARGVWRIALDYLWFPDEATEGIGAATYSNRVANQVILKMKNADSSCLWSYCVPNLDKGCFVTSIHQGWLDDAFMYGPTFASLMVPLIGGEAANQQQVIDLAATKVNSGTVNDYYSGSWTVLSTIMLNGDFAMLKPLLANLA